MKYDFFLSYSNQDREWAFSLGSILRKKRFKVFDFTSVKPGEPLADELEGGLRESRYVILVVSKDSVNSHWIAVELGAALALKKLLIPIVANNVPFKALPAPIKRRKYLSLGAPELVAEQIIHGLEERGNGKKKTGHAAVGTTRIANLPVSSRSGLVGAKKHVA